MSPSLVPLQQWKCDVCGGLIEQPDHGYLEWRTQEDHRRYGFRIVHKAIHSPARQHGENCYYSRAERGGDLDLPRFLGSDGLVKLLSWLDAGEEFHENYPGPQVVDLREWIVLFKRLHLPYFEEAQPYLLNAKSSVEFGEINEAFFNSSETLKSIVDAYSDRT